MKNMACFEQNEDSWHRVLQEEGVLMLQICHFHISDENENAGKVRRCWWHGGVTEKLGDRKRGKRWD